jgi:hypothetical protein
VFENRVLRRIFGPKRDEVTGEWSKLHNEELNNLYCSLNIIRVIKSREMDGWTGHVACMRERVEVHTGFWWVNLMERGHLEDPGLDGDNIKMDLQKVGLRDRDWFDLAENRDRWRLVVNGYP